MEGVALARGPLRVEIGLCPLRIDITRAGRPVVGDLRPWAAEGTVHDRFVQITEGVVAHERLGEREQVPAAVVVEARDDEVVLATGSPFAEVRVGVAGPEHVVVELVPAEGPLRLGLDWAPARGEAFSGLGARHHEAVDHMGRAVRLGADRRYHGPACPAELREDGIPQGDYAPAPWLQSRAGYAVWLEGGGEGVLFDLVRRPGASARAAAGPLRAHLLCHPLPAARLRAYCGLTGFPALLPEWGYGHWKSRDVYEHQDDVLEDFHGYRWHGIPLDAIVIDSPWETQYNTWRFNPHQFPDAPGMVDHLRAAGVRTVVWVTPWVNLDSRDGQVPPDSLSERLHREPAPNYAPGARAGHFVRAPGGEPFVARWWMGTGSPVDFTSPAAEAWWREQAREVLEIGVEGIKADDGEGYYFPEDVRFADGSSGAQAAWDYGRRYRESMQRALDEVHPGRGVLFGRSGWSGQQAQGMLWGGDQVSDFWSLRRLVAASLSAASSGFSNWSHDVGGYLGERLVDRCPRELLVRWVQLGCFTPLMQAHGRFAQEAWTYDGRTRALFREYVLLHERLVPYVRAAAAVAARTGLPVVRSLSLLDPADPRAWSVADAFGYGPSLWVAPVLEKGAREREVPLPRGEWIEAASGRRMAGGDAVHAAAPLELIPLYVRAGSIVVTYPAAHVARGLGDADERARPLEATLWGRPRQGRALARLADGTRIAWHDGRWSVEPDREVAFTERFTAA
jgi:hypothetical protein